MEESFRPLCFNDKNTSHCYAVKTTSYAKYRFKTDFCYNFIALFDKMFALNKIYGINDDIIINILLLADFPCTYSVIFWINPIITSTLYHEKVSENCINLRHVQLYIPDSWEEEYSKEKHSKKSSIPDNWEEDSEEPSIPDNWFLNITPYYYQSSYTCAIEKIFCVCLRLLTKPQYRMKHYHTTLCQYMANVNVDKLCEKNIFLSEKKRICMGTDNEWLLGCILPNGRCIIDGNNDNDNDNDNGNSDSETFDNDIFIDIEDRSIYDLI